MKYEYQLLFKAMVTDIKNCKKIGLSEWENTRACFWITKKYWENLKLTTRNGIFRNQKEEIDFFRNVKPQFFGYMEYFILLGTGLLFMPANESESMASITRDADTELENDTILFWEREEKKFKLFCTKNERFIDYYKTGQRDNDRNYFLRKNNFSNHEFTELHNTDNNFHSSYGHLIEMYIAHKLYNEYVHKKLDSLRSNPNMPCSCTETEKAKLKSSKQKQKKFVGEKFVSRTYKYFIRKIKTEVKIKLLKWTGVKFNHIHNR